MKEFKVKLHPGYGDHGGGIVTTDGDNFLPDNVGWLKTSNFLIPGIGDVKVEPKLHKRNANDPQSKEWGSYVAIKPDLCVKEFLKWYGHLEVTFTLDEENERIDVATSSNANVFSYRTDELEVEDIGFGVHVASLYSGEEKRVIGTGISPDHAKRNEHVYYEDFSVVRDDYTFVLVKLKDDAKMPTRMILRTFESVGDDYVTQAISRFEFD